MVRRKAINDAKGLNRRRRKNLKRKEVMTVGDLSYYALLPWKTSSSLAADNKTIEGPKCSNNEKPLDFGEDIV